MLDLCFGAYLLVLGLLGVYGLHRLYLTACFVGSQPGEPIAPPPLPDQLPIVTVQLPLFNELNVAERLIDAVAGLDWPRDRLEIQVLDDSTDETADICRDKCDALRALGHDIRHLHRVARIGYKAGALEAGLRRARGDLVLILDADFLPEPDLLRRTVGHFADPDLGMVQARWEHLNRNYSALTRIQALLLDGHFAIEQTVRCRTGRFFNFNGTAGIWRRDAIVSAGGWQHDTLTEDLDLSYRALMAGWRFQYLLGDTAPAELPVDMNAFKSQQFRWAKGSVQVARKLLPKVIRARLPWRVKLEAVFHLTQNLPYLLTLVLVLLAVPVLLLRSWDQQLWLDLPLLAGTTGVLAAYCVMSQRALGEGSVWSVLLRVPALIAIAAGISVNQSRAVIEGAAGHQSEFIRTPKHGVTARRQRWTDKRYRGSRSLAPIAEISLAIYFGLAVVLGVSQGRWSALPIVAVFAIGFGYVGLMSVARR